MGDAGTFRRVRMEWAKMVSAPAGIALRGSEAGGVAEAPDSQIEGEDSGNVGSRRGDIARKGKEGMIEGERGRTNKVAAREEQGPGLVDDVAGAVQVGDGILIGAAVKTGRNIDQGDLVLVAHPTRSSEGVVDQGHMVKNKSSRGPFTLLKEGGNNGEPLSDTIGIGHRDGVEG